MSEEKVSLELLGRGVLTLTTEVRDLQIRFTAMEARFGALEQRFGAMETRFTAQEQRMDSMLALIVRIAARLP